MTGEDSQQAKPDPADPSNPALVENDCVLQRYNTQLPPCYRSTLHTERKLLIRALHVLADSITATTEHPETASDPTPESSDIHVSEGYQYEIERDFAALEKAIIRFIDLKHPFDKSDYPFFFNLLIRGALTPNLDIGLRSKLARCSVRLLGKRVCVLPEGIPWLMIINQITAFHIDCVDGVAFLGRDVRDSHCRNFTLLLSRCRHFLAPHDTAESIWNHFLPKLRSPDPDVQFTEVLFMSNILPTQGDAWIGWVPEAIQFWQKLESSSDWDSIWMTLVARLCRHQPCVQDWTEYLPWIYTRIEASCDLPLGVVPPQGSADRRCPLHTAFLMDFSMVPMAARFIAYTLSPQHPTTLRYLKRYFALIANYFHPSNTGRWSGTLALFVLQLTNALVSRVMDERHATEAGISGRVIGDKEIRGVAPAEHRLNEEYVSTLVDILLPLIELGLHSKIMVMSAQSANSARDLAIIKPATVLPSMLQKALEGLESISSPHRTTAALRLLSSLTPVFLDPDVFPEGADYLPQALQLTLPGIDPNDPGKTENTLRFIANAAASIQGIINSERMPVSEDFLDEYICHFLNRIFSLLDSLEAPPKKNAGGYGSGQPLSFFVFSVAVENLFIALPRSVALSAARMVAKQLTCAACSNAMKFYGALVRISAATAATACKGSSVDIFIPLLTGQLLEENDQPNDSAKYILVSVGEDELVWRIRMLAQACRCIGTGIEPHLDRISWIIRLAFDNPARAIYKAGGRLLRGVLEGLTSIQMKYDVGCAGEAPKMQVVPEGEMYSFEWREPTKDEWRVAEDFLLQFVKYAEEMCPINASSDADEIAANRDVLFRVLRMLHAAQRGGRWLLGGAQPAHFSELERYIDQGTPLSKEDAKLILKRPIAAGLGGERRDVEGQAFATKTWTRMFTFALEIMSVASIKRPDDGALLYRCLEPLEIAHEPFRCGVRSRQTFDIARLYKSAYRPIISAKRPHGAEGGVGRVMPRFIVKLRVEALHELRLTKAGRGGIEATVLVEDIMKKVRELSLNDFPRVRGEARGVLTRALRCTKPAVRHREICGIISVLKNSVKKGDKSAAKDATGDTVMGEGNTKRTKAEDVMEIDTSSTKEDVMYEKLIGASSVLRSSAVAPLIMRDTHLFIDVVHALIEAIPRAERPDASGALTSLFGKLFSLTRAMGIDPVRLIDSDLVTVPSIKLSNAEETERISKWKEYEELNEFLLGILGTETKAEVIKMNGENSSIPSSKGEAHWRVQTLIAVLLFVLLRKDHAPSPKVVQFFVKGLVSDVVGVRHICGRAVGLIMALHGRKSGVAHPQGDKFDDSPDAWAEAGNEAMASLGRKICTPSFVKTLVHTLALDHDEDGDSGFHRSSVLFAMLSCSRISDGESCWTMMGGRPWPTSWTPRSRDSLNLIRVRLYEGFVRVFGMKMLDALMPCLVDLLKKLEAKEEKIISGVQDEDVRVLAAEIVAGICRGLDVYHCNDKVKCDIFEVTKSLLSDMSGPLGNVNGATCIRLIGTSDEFVIGKQILRDVLEWQLEGKPLIVKMGNGTLAHLQSRRLRFIHSCVADIDDAADERLRRVTNQGVEDLVGEIGFNHELKTVREEVGRLLSLLSVYVSPDCEKIFGKAMVSLCTRLGSSGTVEVTDADKNGMVDDDNAEEDVRRKSRSRQGETLSRFVSIVYWNGRARMFEKYIAKVLPALFESFDESDGERISHAQMALSLTAQGTFGVETIEGMLDEVEATAKDHRWKDSSLGRIRSIVLSLLSDSQLEVRQAAAASFVTMIRDAEDGIVDEVRKGCLKVLNETAPKRRGGKRVPIEGHLVCKRHGAVLALSSMVTSCPYSVPEWMPSVLVALSSCVNDAPPICTGVRDLFGDFMRTHRDEWQLHREAFTADELDIVSELLVSPSYYA